MRSVVFGLVLVVAVPGSAVAQSGRAAACDMSGIGATKLIVDGPPASIVDASTAVGGSGRGPGVPYCLVKVRVPEAINIWVALPIEGAWNGRLQSVGGGGYAGTVAAPTAAAAAGYVGVATDTGHSGGDGSFGMLAPGQPNTALQIDFAYRSEHLMAVVGKQLARAFYGRPPEFSYWNGCSTGGRQGLMMAQRFPDDYNGIVAGAPAIHWDRFQAAQIWPQVAMRIENGGPVPVAKLNHATAAAVAACDAKDGVVDGVVDDPRACTFSARSLLCAAGADPGSCLGAKEAAAIDRIWQGPVIGDKRLWFAPQRGASLNGLAGPNPFPIAIAQPRYWVYLDPSWRWESLEYDNYQAFFDRTVRQVGPVIATDDANLTRFRDRGGKLILWHGWADPLIMPEGSIDYYERVVTALGGEAAARRTARLFMAPGVGHCGGGEGPAPQDLLGTIVRWVERGDAPETILASRPLPGGGTRTRPLCMYPATAVWNGTGSSDDATNFVCRRPEGF